MPDATSLEPTGKVTIYLMGGFGMGYRKIEAKTAEVRRKRYAQYESAVELTFREPRQRRDRSVTQGSHPNIVILDGWGHFDPADPFTHEAGPTAITSMSRHSLFSGEWDKEFDAALAAHVAESGATVLRDYRGCDTHDMFRG